MRHFVRYSEFECMWERFNPETPFGRDVKEKRAVYTRKVELTTIWDLTDIALNFLSSLQGSEVTLNRITHHLKRLPRFPEDSRPLYDQLELFQVKKFMHNYRSLVQLLTPEVRSAFRLDWSSDKLYDLLDKGRQSAETFYISDEYSTDLAQVRAEIREVDERIRSVRKRRAQEIEERWGFLFGLRDFLVVARDEVGDAGRASEFLVIEPYDEHSVVVRPLRSGEELVLAERRASLLVKERTAEDEVMERLSSAVRSDLMMLRGYREAVQEFDLAFARARMARVHGLTRPFLGDGPLEIEKGRFLPCEEVCDRLGTTYEPLSACFDTSVTVIFGSNMGGKTVVLKTLAFLQLCAQSGFFVPAARFVTRVFEHFHYVGEGCLHDAAQGLSGFGFEMRQFMEAYQDFSRPTLVLFDEFARTTHSQEAEALISAAIASMANNLHLVALFSTHFRGVRRIADVRYLRMQGLNREGLDFREAVGAELDERIRLIDRRMEYRVVPDDGASRLSDAIAVAALLGVEPGIVERAQEFFAENH